MGAAAEGLHLLLFGPGAVHGLSVLRNAHPLLLLLVPAAGGLLLGLLLGLSEGLGRIGQAAQAQVAQDRTVVGPDAPDVHRQVAGKHVRQR